VSAGVCPSRGARAEGCFYNGEQALTPFAGRRGARSCSPSPRRVGEYLALGSAVPSRRGGGLSGVRKVTDSKKIDADSCGGAACAPDSSRWSSLFKILLCQASSAAGAR